MPKAVIYFDFLCINEKDEEEFLHTSDYTVFTCDIREIDELFKKLKDYNLDFS